MAFQESAPKPKGSGKGSTRGCGLREFGGALGGGGWRRDEGEGEGEAGRCGSRGACRRMKWDEM
jgi:hypothetical protein